ncbi:PepSY domain-containing protein [Gellertiella hungarica]|uniref:Cobalamin biosynthesis protein CobT n=1 Tax=Gellertiella hungarica TaxID=1572859 RepID=A0A7W6J9K2_9HYPH|nr:hypothetical protein [Gellertiella hungarica]MBB4066411.1 cobalamin biosynthesis protein CobT [Gellertiella hungarica]
MDRRTFILALSAAWLGLAAPVLAKDGEGKGGDGDGEGEGEGESSGNGGEGGSGKGGDGDSDSDGGSDHGSGSGSGSGDKGGSGSGSGSGRGNSGSGKGNSGKNSDDDDGDDDASGAPMAHDAARSAVSRGEVMPYRDVLEKLRSRSSGRVLRVELDRAAGKPVYRMRVEDEAGFVSTVTVDARTGRVLMNGIR